MPAFPPQDRLIRKEVALGTLREAEPPMEHIGLRTIAPWLEVASDDVIFDYTRGLADGLAPARAEDAESELAQKDLILGGQGRASVIDWALKDYYTASDVARYRETLLLAGRLGEIGTTNMPLTIGSQVEDFRNKVARDDALRRRKLDNRIEWLIMTALTTGGLAYNDGKIRFGVDFGRPANQTNQNPQGGTFNNTTSDPIGAILAMQEFMNDTHGVKMRRAVTSQKVINQMWNSDRFIARAAGVPVGGTPSSPIDLNYMMDGWGPDAAVRVIERVTGVQFEVYDAVYRTRPIGSTTITNNRFTDENMIYFLPDPATYGDLDDAIGFARTLTSPHPEGNWTPGYYEWEEDTRDPWGTTRGTGVKAFPVFMHMEWTYTMRGLPA
jgi:hypothetical protein